MAGTPAFTATVRCAMVAISTANANRDGTGTIGTVGSAGSSGTRWDRVIIKATVTTTAGTVRLYIHDGSAYFLLTEVSIPAVSVSATQPAYETVVPFPDGLLMPSGYSLRASTEKAENFNVIAQGGDF